jgi:hypothetical protein
MVIQQAPQQVPHASVHVPMGYDGEAILLQCLRGALSPYFASPPSPEIPKPSYVKAPSFPADRSPLVGCRSSERLREATSLGRSRGL